MIVFYILLGVLPLVQHPTWSQKVGPFTVFESLGLLSMVCAVVRVASRRRLPPIFASWVTRCFLLLYIIALFSALTEPQWLTLANQPFINYTSTMFLFVLTISLIDTLTRLRWAILVLVGSYAWASLYLIREFQKGIAWSSGYRAGWIVGDSNYFSTGAIFAIVLTFCFMQRSRTRLERWYCWGCLIITLVGVTVCASRGGFLGLASASLLFVAWTKNRIRNLATLVILLIGLSIILPVSPLHRWLNPSGPESTSEESHWQSWQAGLRMIGAHPLAGVGLGRFKAEMPQFADSRVTEYHVAHNMFLEVAAELGIPAFLCLAAIFVSSFRELGRLRRSAQMLPIIRNAAAALQAAVVGVAVSGCFVSVEYEKTTWVGFALISCLFPLAQSSRRRAIRRQALPSGSLATAN
ncbi:MAG: O-antigen ligase family protein [Candidatus Sulfotelmatobacter sp.]